MLVQWWKSLFPDLDDDDLQGLPNKVSKSKIFDMACSMISFGNINEEMLKNDYRVMHVKWPAST
jgi:hypothetical protein